MALFIGPLAQTDGRVLLVLVLEKENLDRMREADPFDLQLRDYPVPLVAARALNFIIAYEEETDAVLQFNRAGDIPGLLNYLQRNRQMKPGDAEPPVKFA